MEWLRDAASEVGWTLPNPDFACSADGRDIGRLLGAGSYTKLGDSVCVQIKHEKKFKMCWLVEAHPGVKTGNHQHYSSRNFMHLKGCCTNAASRP